MGFFVSPGPKKCSLPASGGRPAGRVPSAHGLLKVRLQEPGSPFCQRWHHVLASASAGDLGPLNAGAQALGLPCLPRGRGEVGVGDLVSLRHPVTTLSVSPIKRGAVRTSKARAGGLYQHSRGLQGEVSTARPLLAVGPRRAQAPKRRYPLRPGPKMATGPGGRLGARAAEPLPLPSGPCAGDAGQRRRGRGRAWRRGVAPASRQRRRVLPARSPSSGPWRALPAGILGSPRQSSRLGPRGRAIRLVPKMVALGSRATAGGGRA